MGAKTQQLQIRVTPSQKASIHRLASRAGQNVSSYVLARALPDVQRRFREILQTLGDDSDRRFALAELHDFLAALAPSEFADAVADAEIERLGPLVANYVAAMVEQAASIKRTNPPGWAADVEPLTEPWFAVPFPSLRFYLLRVSPIAFKRRNIFVDSTVGDRV